MKEDRKYLFLIEQCVLAAARKSVAPVKCGQKSDIEGQTTLLENGIYL